jgi:signal transduction histidine kinase
MLGTLPKPILTNFSPLLQTRLIERYSIGLAVGVLAILLRALLDPVLGHVAFYVTVYMGVVFSALVCGLAPALLTASVGFLGILYWFIDPRNSLSIPRQSEIHGVIGFFLVSVVLIALGDANRRKQLRLNNIVAALKEEAHQRECAQRELRNAHDQLEQRVEQRTAELSEALARLESEIEVRKQTEEQLRQLSVRLMTLQDEERRRIARDLHDTTGQTLTALKISIASIQQLRSATPEVLQVLDDLNGFADEALREIRTTSYLLHPPLLDEAGFASAARWFVEGFAKRSNIPVQLEIAESPERLSRNCELALFRVLQESLTNVHRHSRASAADVKFTISDSRLQLVVHDNGRGIEEHRLQKFRETKGEVGVGIAGMRERIRELGGTLEVCSDQSGTTLSVALPTAKALDSQISVAVHAS